MKIIYVSLEGFGKLKFAEFKPKDSVVELIGANATGKSAVMNGLWAIMQTYRINDKHKDYETPVNYDSDKAVLTMDIGLDVPMFRARRVIHKDGSSALTVKDLINKTSVTTPATFMKELLSLLAQDPLSFLTKTAQEQFDIICRIKRIDFCKYYERIEDIKSRKSEAIKAISTCETTISVLEARKNTSLSEDIISKGRVVLEDITGKIKEYNRVIEFNKGKEDEKKEIIKKKSEAELSLINLKAKIKELESNIKQYDSDIESVIVQDLPGYDIEALEQQKENGFIINAEIDLREEIQKGRAKKGSLEVSKNTLSTKVADLLKEMKVIAANKECPVEGIEIDPENKCVLYNGHPLADASEAESILKCMEIAMSEDPELKALLLKRGSSLDSTSLEKLRSMATAKNFTVFVETATRNTNADADTFEIIGAEVSKLETSC